MNAKEQSATKGRFETLELGNFRLHVYHTNDVMGDVSFLIEGPDGLVTLEQPLFKDNIAEFDAYEASLGKPVVQRITDYHLGGTGDHPILMPEGMHAFTQGDIYGGMMKGFAQQFGDAITAMPTGKVSEVAFDKPVAYAGVSFRFVHGATNDFPAAGILIGGHGAGVGTVDDVRFKIDYLKKMKALRASEATPEAFAAALRSAYPGLPGEEGIDALAKALYQ